MPFTAAAYFDRATTAKLQAAPSRGLDTKFSRTFTFWLMQLNQTTSTTYLIRSYPLDDSDPEGKTRDTTSRAKIETC